MVSVDTNLIVRILINDDRKQAKKARNIFANNDIFICKTVMLECFWVLTYTYDISVKIAIDSILQLISLSNVTLENNTALIQALDLAQQGMDFADALHLLSSSGSKKFATFDNKFIKTAKKLNTDIKVFSP